jgi:tyramine---L-glutamate ligase
MKSQRTLFVCEFITGGGLAGADLPESLVREAILMRDALLSDLVTYADWSIVTTCDVRFPPFLNVKSIEIQQGADTWETWRLCMESADAVWVIAPESAGVLHQLAELAHASQAVWVGAGLNAIEIASNKYRMAQVLGDAKLPVIPSYFYKDWNSEQMGPWLVKPNDGAGCEETFVLKNTQAVTDWFAVDSQRLTTHIIQPYLQGIPASISLLGLKESAEVLSCNLQSITLQNGQLCYKGGVVNGAAEYWDQLSRLANQIKAVMPDLMGYFGVDVLLDIENQPSFTIIEINPRLTTSYAHLHEAMGCNPAKLVMDAMLGKSVDISIIKRKRVAFDVEHKV